MADLAAAGLKQLIPVERELAEKEITVERDHPPHLMAAVGVVVLALLGDLVTPAVQVTVETALSGLAAAAITTPVVVAGLPTPLGVPLALAVQVAVVTLAHKELLQQGIMAQQTPAEAVAPEVHIAHPLRSLAALEARVSSLSDTQSRRPCGLLRGN